MSYMRAAGLTTLLVAMLTTTALIIFGNWYAGYSSTGIAERILLWFPISLIGVTPICLVLFPLIHALMNLRGQPAGRMFALIGGVCAAAVAGFALFRFRAILFPNPGIAIVAIPVMVIAAVIIGFIAGFLFERLARRKPTPPLRASDGSPAESDKPSA